MPCPDHVTVITVTVITVTVTVTVMPINASKLHLNVPHVSDALSCPGVHSTPTPDISQMWQAVCHNKIAAGRGPAAALSTLAY